MRAGFVGKTDIGLSWERALREHNARKKKILHKKKFYIVKKKRKKRKKRKKSPSPSPEKEYKPSGRKRKLRSKVEPLNDD